MNEAKLDSKPYVDAVRNVILNSFYAMLSVIGLVIIIGALGYGMFKYLKSRNMIRVIKIYEMDEKPAKFKEVLIEHEKREARKELLKEQKEKSGEKPG